MALTLEERQGLLHGAPTAALEEALSQAVTCTSMAEFRTQMAVAAQVLDLLLRMVERASV